MILLLVFFAWYLVIATKYEYKMKSKTKRQDESVYDIKGPLNPYDDDEEDEDDTQMSGSGSESGSESVRW